MITTKQTVTKKLLHAVSFLLFVLAPLFLKAQTGEQLQGIVDQYNSLLTQLKIPRLQLAYLDNLNGILDDESRTKQLTQLSSLKNQLDELDVKGLMKERQYQYQHLVYLVDMQLRRIDLENRFKQKVSGKIDDNRGIYHQALGKEWYQYFLDSWLSVKKNPQELFIFGETEVTKVRKQIKEVQEAEGFKDDENAFYSYLNSDQFILNNAQEVAENYQSRKTMVSEHLGYLFKDLDLPEVRIESFPESNKDTPPGQLVFTPDPTFYFNFFAGRHNIQDMDFLYLHEVFPGHAFHSQYDAEHSDKRYSLKPIFAYHGLSEGWGAYVEELGAELGLYQTPVMKMGKLKFDLVRSARVVLDVGINYFGWDNQRALDYWSQHIKGQDDIAQREIDRVRRWPGQAISYKVGSAKFLELRAQAQEALGNKFDIRDYHHQILAFGGLPLFLVEKRILEYIHST